MVINCNPETVSTDYDESDRLYFEADIWRWTCGLHDGSHVLFVPGIDAGNRFGDLQLRAASRHYCVCWWTDVCPASLFPSQVCYHPMLLSDVLSKVSGAGANIRSTYAKTFSI